MSLPTPQENANGINWISHPLEGPYGNARCIFRGDFVNELSKRDWQIAAELEKMKFDNICCEKCDKMVQFIKELRGEE